MLRLMIFVFIVLPTLGQDCTTDCNRVERVVRAQGPVVETDDVAAFYGQTKRRRAAFVVDDRQFMRRASLDIRGTLPSPQEVEAFLADSRADKRSVYIEYLLNSDGFTYRWATFFEDMFDNRFLLGAGLFRNGVEAFFRENLKNNTAMDVMFRQFIASRGTYEGGDPIGFYFDVLFDDVFRLDYLDDKVSQISQNLLGIDTSCISCHDGAYHLENVNKGLSVATRREFWGMAAFLSGTYVYYRGEDYGEDDPFRFEKNLQIVDFGSDYSDGGTGRFFPYSEDVITGEYVAESEPGQGQRSPRSGGLIEPSYLFGGGVAEGETRREALARHITSDRQFARNMVNRVWAHFFGEGFVEELGGWDMGRIDAETAAGFGATVQARNSALMEHLTDTFIESGYDLKALIGRLTRSSLYQADHGNIELDSGEALGYWYGPVRERRLEAEALVDGIRSRLGQDWRYVVSGRTHELLNSTWQLPGKNEPDTFGIFYPEYVDPVSLGFPDQETFFFMQGTTMDMLDSFGRGNSFAMMPRSNETTIPTMLAALNDTEALFWLEDLEYSPYLQDVATALENGLQAGEVVDRLFHHFLFRDPTIVERQAIISHLNTLPAEEALPNIAWAFFNHPDFWYR